jgi:phosphohistidine phosphatase
VSAPSRTLWLLRHAKAVADPPDDGDDFDRVLAPRGRRDAAALGHLMARNGKGPGKGLEKGQAKGLEKALAKAPFPEVAFVSPSARTTATAEIVLDEGSPSTRLEFPTDLYGAGPEDVLNHLRALGDDVSSAMVVGHNPTTEALAAGLLSTDDKNGRDLLVRCGFPTCALAVVRLDIARWADVAARCGVLYGVLTPPFDKT